MKYILDDDDRVKIIGLFAEGYCDHGISLDELCVECESEAETAGIDVE